MPQTSSCDTLPIAHACVLAKLSDGPAAMPAIVRMAAMGDVRRSAIGRAIRALLKSGEIVACDDGTYACRRLTADDFPDGIHLTQGQMRRLERSVDKCARAADRLHDQVASNRAQRAEVEASLAQ